VAVWAAISNLNCLQTKEAADRRSAASFLFFFEIFSIVISAFPQTVFLKGKPSTLSERLA
jgi:hypothetical protein